MNALIKDSQPQIPGHNVLGSLRSRGKTAGQRVRHKAKLDRVEGLDLATVVNVSQALSGEMVLEKLVDMLMRAAIEQVGAERGILISPRSDELLIDAEATARGGEVAVHVGDGHVHLEVALPELLIRYSIRTRESVILDDAVFQNQFSADPYIARRLVRSILCLPLINRGKLIGILYLENNLAPRAFAPDRVTLLKVLASQAAISLENSRLYRDLADREGRIRHLVDANIIGTFVWKVAGPSFNAEVNDVLVVEANDAFLSMVGYDRADLTTGRLRRSALELPEWRARDASTMEEVRATGTVQPFEKEYLHKDGHRVPVLVGFVAFDDRRLEGYAFVLDLTERKRAEVALRELEANIVHMNRVSMMGELAASLSHEVTQPIASARNNACAAQKFLDMQPPEFGDVKEALTSVVSDVDRAGGIIDRIRDQIRKAPVTKHHFDLNAAINEVIVLVRSVTMRNGVSVQTRFSDGMSHVHGDRVQLQQVVLNLILNAVEAISSIAVGRRELHIGTAQDQTGVLVLVRDSGPGIDPTDLERVFEAFYTTKSCGTGMGLSICRSIIDAHGGRLWVDANKPRGATFQFTLPA